MFSNGQKNSHNIKPQKQHIRIFNKKTKPTNDRNHKILPLKELTYEINGAAIEVHKTLGRWAIRESIP